MVLATNMCVGDYHLSSGFEFEAPLRLFMVSEDYPAVADEHVAISLSHEKFFCSPAGAGGNYLGIATDSVAGVECFHRA